ncbi:MAG: efflux RND transporter periplasmic adaptor subunit [Kofleriaceae bacterium]
MSQQDQDRADADVQAAQSDVDRLRALKSFDLIRAPFDGIVTKRYVDVGALMPAPTGSTQSAQPLVDVADISKVRIVVYVGQRDATNVSVGDKVSITRDDDPTHPIEAAVTRIPKDLDLTTRTMWVEAEVPNPEGKLYPGLFVTVTLDVQAAAGVVIPSDAITLIQGKATVAKIETGIIHFVPVVVGDDDGKTARIVSGLKVNDQIATRVNDELADGAVARAVTPDELDRRKKEDASKKKDGQGSNAGSAGSAAAPPKFPGTGPETPSGSAGATPSSSTPANGSGAAPSTGGSLGTSAGSGSAK